MEDQEQRLKTVATVVYALQAAGFFVGITWIVAVIVDYVKRDDARGTWQESHFSWRIRSVLWAGGLYLVTAPLWLLFLIPGWIAWAIISIWFLYRVVRGWLALNERKPMLV